MNKLTISLAAGALLLGGGPILASASEVDVKEDLKDMARSYEAGWLNKAYGTSFKPSDEPQTSVGKDGSLYKITPPVKGDRRISKDGNLSDTYGQIDVINEWGEVDKVNPELSNSPLYAGNNVLDNSKGTSDQDLLTPEYSYKFTETVSTKTSIGLKVGEKLTAKIDIPYFGGSSSETSMEVSFGHDDMNSKSKEVTYKSPSQKIHVPAGKT